MSRLRLTAVTVTAVTCAVMVGYKFLLSEDAREALRRTYSVTAKMTSAVKDKINDLAGIDVTEDDAEQNRRSVLSQWESLGY